MTTPVRQAEALAGLADSFWEGYLAGHPLFATILGERRFDDRLDDISQAAVAAERARLGEVLAQARAIDPAGLSSADRVTRSALIEEAANELSTIETGVDDWTVDPLEGVHVRLLDLPDFQPFDTPAEGRTFVERLRGAERYFADRIAALERSRAAGRVAVRAPVVRAIDELRGDERLPLEEWSLLRPSLLEHPDWPDGAADDFATNLTAVVRDVVRPAFVRYREYLERAILPVARSVDQPGIMHLPGGADAYRRLVRAHTTLDLEPAEVHALGLREIERTDREFAELGGRVLGTSGLAETLEGLRNDPALRFSTSEEVQATADSAVARAAAAIPRWFGRLPHAPCVVVRIPEHSEAHQTLAYYTWPAADGSRPGRYYINLYAPETRPRYEAQALAYHEAIPGHHLQLAIAEELDGLPAFRRFLGPTSFIEGWGLYAERLSDEMGLYSSDLDRLGVISFDAWRGCRLVVDSGMHALGWTRQQAIEFMTAHTALGANNIENEVDRYIVWPGQSLAYKVGQLEFLRLRDEARAALGDGFDIRAFHDAVLGEGAVAIGTLGEIVRGWIAETAKAKTAQDSPTGASSLGVP